MPHRLIPILVCAALALLGLAATASAAPQMLLISDGGPTKTLSSRSSVLWTREERKLTAFCAAAWDIGVCP